MVVSVVFTHVKSGPGDEEENSPEENMAAKREPRNSPEVIERIRALMKERRYNPSSFALALKRTRPWGYQFMDNQILMSVDLLEKIAGLLGVSVDYLLYGKEPNHSVSAEEFVRRIVRDEIARVNKPSE